MTECEKRGECSWLIQRRHDFNAISVHRSLFYGRSSLVLRLCDSLPSEKDGDDRERNFGVVFVQRFFFFVFAQFNRLFLLARASE